MGFKWLFLPFFISSTWTERNEPFSWCMSKHSQVLNCCPAIYHQDLFELSLPQQSCRRVCVPMSFKVVPLGLDRPMILGAGIVVDDSRWLGTLILVIPITSERLPFSLQCNPTLHHMLFRASWKSGNHTLNFGGCHVCCGRSPLGEHRI